LVTIQALYKLVYERSVAAKLYRFRNKMKVHGKYIVTKVTYGALVGKYHKYRPPCDICLY